MKADNISGSAFPATLALRIRELEPKGFKLDGVVTVIDCVNFRGYEDTSPSAKVCFFIMSEPSVLFPREGKI
jgi:G3E family GTPase